MTNRLNFVCVDNSPFSENGFDWYLNHFHRKDDTIGLVHVQRLPMLPYMNGVVSGIPLSDEYEKNIEDCIKETNAIQKKFEQICKQKSLSCKFFSPDAHYSPGHVICELAKEKNADSIVVGQRGLGTISRSLLGSTSDHILHHSPAPVIVIPADKKINKNTKT